MTDLQSPPLVTRPVSTVAELLQEAKTAFSASLLAEAILYAKQVLAIEPISDEELDTAYEIWANALTSQTALEEVIKVTDQWITQSKRPYGRIGGMLSQANALRRMGQLQKALGILEVVTPMAESHGERRQMAVSMRMKADILWTEGKVEEAISLLRKVLPLLEAVGEIKPQIQAMISMAIALHLTGRFYNVITVLQRAQRLAESIQDTTAQWIVMNNMGEAYQHLYQVEKALECHLRATELRRGLPSIDLERNLGMDYQLLGRYDEAEKHFQVALEMSIDSADKEFTMQVLFSMAIVRLYQGQLEQAEDFARQLHNEAQKAGFQQHVGRGSLALGQIAAARGDTATAEKYFQSSQLIAQDSQDRDLIWQAHAAHAELVSTTHPEMAAVHRMMATEIIDSTAALIEDEALRNSYLSAPPIAKVVGASRRSLR